MGFLCRHLIHPRESGYGAGLRADLLRDGRTCHLRRRHKYPRKLPSVLHLVLHADAQFREDQEYSLGIRVVWVSEVRTVSFLVYWRL